MKKFYHTLLSFLTNRQSFTEADLVRALPNFSMFTGSSASHEEVESFMKADGFGYFLIESSGFGCLSRGSLAVEN